MPQGNRQGPDGAGPMTGRGMGYCAGYDTAGFLTAPGFGGRGQGFGAGRRFGRGGSAFGAGRRGAGFRRGGGFASGYGAGWGVGRGQFNYGPGGSYWGEGAQTPETRDALLREEIDLLSNRVEALKRELEASAQAPDTPSEDA